MVEEIKRVTALGSPGILLELGELQAYNLLAFEKAMVQLAQKSPIAQKFNKITQKGDEDALRACASEIAIDQINSLHKLKLDVPKIQ